jgi:hypothetical protein
VFFHKLSFFTLVRGFLSKTHFTVLTVFLSLSLSVSLSPSLTSCLITQPFIDLSSQIASLISLALAVKRLKNQRTTKFAYISFIFTFLDSLRWNIGKHRYFLAGLTNPHYKRMKDMEEHLRQADAQEQVLSLQNYFLNEYKDNVGKDW